MVPTDVTVNLTSNFVTTPTASGSSSSSSASSLGQAQFVNQALDFQGLYTDIQQALKYMYYAAGGGCNLLQHGELLVVKVMNEDNAQHDVTMTIPVVVTRVNVAPKITAPQYPRWSLQGLGLGLGSGTSGEVAEEYSYWQVQADVIQKLYLGTSTSTSGSSSTSIAADGSSSVGVGSSLPVRVWNMEETSQQSDLAVFQNAHSTYVLGVQYGSDKVTLLSSSYVPPDTPTTLVFTLDDGAFQTNNNSNVSGPLTFACIVDGLVFPATLLAANTTNNINTNTNSSSSSSSSSSSTSSNNSTSTNNTNTTSVVAPAPVLALVPRRVSCQVTCEALSRLPTATMGVKTSWVQLAATPTTPTSATSSSSTSTASSSSTSSSISTSTVSSSGSSSGSSSASSSNDNVMLSNYLPLFIYPLPAITSYTPSAMYLSRYLLPSLISPILSPYIAVITQLKQCNPNSLE